MQPATVETPSASRLTSVLNLHQAEDANVLIRSNEYVMEWYSERMDKREQCHDFVRGNPWTDEDREVAEQKKKALVEFNFLKTSERTFVGNIIQQRYDVKPAPREPTDQDKSDVYTAMYHWTADITDVRFKDPALVRAAWAGGSAWQESYVEITPGRKPRIVVENQNNFGIYPDPNRRDLVNNSDCEFIDRVSWLSVDGIVDAFPDKEDEIRAALPDLARYEYDKDSVYKDRAHEWKNYRNGKYKIIERFFKVRRRLWFGVGQDGARMDLGYDVDHQTRTAFQEDYPAHSLHMEREESLWLAVTCPSIGPAFLYRDEYHCQPRDPVTGRIFFPFVELIDEELDGEPSGHVEHQIGAMTLTNSLMTNKLYQAKNAAGQSHVVESDFFNPDDLEDLMENHTDGARTFPKKKGVGPGSGVYVIEQGKSAPDNDAVLNFATGYIQEVSSTPPSMKGLSEGNVPGVLNEQRIQQSFIQSQNFTNNYMGFLVRRARLWKYYWKEFFDAEEVIRVLEKKDPEDPDWIAVNKVVADEFGQPYKANSLDDGDAYDITFEDSWKSPTVRDKVRQQIVQLQQSTAVQADPVLNAFLTYYFVQLSDAPQDMKSLIREHSSVIKQQEAQKQAAEQDQAFLDQQAQMQDIAQKGAEGTALAPASGPSPAAPQRGPQPAMPPPPNLPERQAVNAY